MWSHSKHESATNAPARSRKRKNDNKAEMMFSNRSRCRHSDIQRRPQLNAHDLRTSAERAKLGPRKKQDAIKHTNKNVHYRFAQPNKCLRLIQEPQIAQPKRSRHTFPPMKPLPTHDIPLSISSITHKTKAQRDDSHMVSCRSRLTSIFKDRRHDHEFCSKSLDTILVKKRQKQTRYALCTTTKHRNATKSS